MFKGSSLGVHFPPAGFHVLKSPQLPTASSAGNQPSKDMSLSGRLQAAAVAISNTSSATMGATGWGFRRQVFYTREATPRSQLFAGAAVSDTVTNRLWEFPEPSAWQETVGHHAILSQLTPASTPHPDLAEWDPHNPLTLLEPRLQNKTVSSGVWGPPTVWRPPNMPS